MPRILITGSESFIGTNFLKYSRYSEGVEVISLVKKNLALFDFSKYDILLHLAAIAQDSGTISESDYFGINCTLCLDVAKKAKESGIKHLIFLSSVKVYGPVSYKGEIRNEFSICQPVDPYGRSKLAAESGLRKLEDKSFIISIIRTPIVYGEGAKGNMLKLVGLVDKISWLPFDDINNKRSFTYAGNLIAGIDRIIEKKASGTFLIKDDRPVSTTDLLTYIADSLNKKIFLFKLTVVIRKLVAYLFPGFYEKFFESLEFENSWTVKTLEINSETSVQDGILAMVRHYKGRNHNQL